MLVKSVMISNDFGDNVEVDIFLLALVMKWVMYRFYFTEVLDNTVFFG
jgi:hypothetical protein